MIFWENSARGRSSMPSRGTTCVLTFNLTNILAESVNRSNALFWLTAKDRGPRIGVTGAVSYFRFGYLFGGWG